MLGSEFYSRGSGDLSKTLKFCKDSKWREFRGKQYLNCDDYSEGEMEVVEDWEHAPTERKEAMIKKNGWEDKGLFRRDVSP